MQTSEDETDAQVYPLPPQVANLDPNTASFKSAETGGKTGKDDLEASQVTKQPQPEDKELNAEILFDDVELPSPMDVADLKKIRSAAPTTANFALQEQKADLERKFSDEPVINRKQTVKSPVKPS